MGFNYAQEKRKFDKEWEKLHNEYEAAGMSEAAIAQMKAFDWGWFCSRRVYAKHNQPLPDDMVSDEDGTAKLFRKFAGLSVTLENMETADRYGWLSEIGDEQLYHRLSLLNRMDLELLTLIVVDGYSQSEIARIWGCTPSAVSQRMKKIKKHLKDA